PFGHSRTACSIAPSCVPAYETCNWMIFFERVRILPRLLGAPGKPAQQHRDLLIRRADRDDTIGETAHALRHDRPGRCDIDRRRGSWQRIQLRAFYREVCPAMLRDASPPCPRTAS